MDHKVTPSEKLYSYESHLGSHRGLAPRTCCDTADRAVIPEAVLRLCRDRLNLAGPSL